MLEYLHILPVLQDKNDLSDSIDQDDSETLRL